MSSTSTVSLPGCVGIAVVIIFFKILFPSRLAGFPPLPPLRTVHATFTAHGSCNSKLILVLTNSALTSAQYYSMQPVYHCWLRTHTALHRSIAFPHSMGSTCLFSENHLTEVCPLSRGMMLQSLSLPLQQGLRFLRSHLPADHSAIVTTGLPSSLWKVWRPTGLPSSVNVTSSDLGPVYPPVELHPCGLSRKKTNLSTCHFGLGSSASVNQSFVTMVNSDDSLTLSMSVSLAAARSDAPRLATLSRSSAPRRYQRRTIGRLLLTEQEVLKFQRTITFTTSCRNSRAKVVKIPQI